MNSIAIQKPINRKQKQIIAKSINLLIWLFLIAFALLILLPLFFMFTASIMDSKEIITMPYRWIPSEIK